MRRIAVTALATLAAAAVLLTCSAYAQRLRNRPAQKRQSAKQQKPKQSKQGQKEKKTKPQAIDLETADGVLIAGTYFPSPGGFNSPVAILIHGYGETQDKLWDLAFKLQDAGYAVFTYDSRGHGYSTKRVGVAAARNAPPIRYHDLGRRVPFASLTLDLEAIRNFLVERNNAKELNLSRLAIVGCHIGAITAVRFAFHDWSVPQPDFQGKMCCDVQALVLISPPLNFKGYSAVRELRAVAAQMPILVIVGAGDSKAARDANKLFKIIRRAMPEGSKLHQVDTKLQGTKLLDPDLKLGVDKVIIEFLNRNVRGQAAKWEEHEKR